MINSTIEQARKGDEDAFRALMEIWYPRIYQYVYKYFSGKSLRGNIKDLSAEVTQKTFISAFRSIQNLNDYTKFRAWLYRIATNYCFEEDRRQKRKKLTSLLPFSSENESESIQLTMSRKQHPEHQYQQSEMSVYLKAALAKINPDQRTVILMKEYEELSFREIAEVLQISENTAKSRLYYGLKALRKIFAQWELTENMFSYEEENI